MTSKSNPVLLSFFQNTALKVLIVCFGLLSSCVTQRKVEYLRERDISIKEFKEADFPDYKLKPNDEVYIKVKSLDDEAANIFADSRLESSYTGAMQPYGASLLSYSIDKDGYLFLSVVGKILVKDKTLSEVSAILKESLKGILNQPNVSVKLVNRYVTVLGEVNHPGHYAYSKDKLTVFDALGLAGDIGDYGNRKKVILIRNTAGQNIRINLDLNKAEILASEYYYMRPNDIVYVKPLREKFWGLRQFPYSIILSTLTTGLLIYSIVK
jgi:polysaccharide export outer membrane protein